MSLADGARATAKRLVERIAVGGGLAALSLRARRGDVAILAYHDIVPDGETPVGDASLHLPQRAFAAQLDQLLRTHDVVPLAALSTRGDGAPRRPRAVITFDDAYAGALTAGVEELARRSLQATMFVAPAFLGGAGFWWDALPMGDDARVRTKALEEWRGVDAEVRREAVRAGMTLREPPSWSRCASLEQLRASAPTLAYGAHTWSHPNLARLEAAVLRDELARPLAWLRATLPNPVPWLAYPYGRWSPAVAAAASAAGYDGAFIIEGGLTVWPPADRFAVPRIDVPAGVSTDGFAMRVAGLLAR